MESEPPAITPEDLWREWGLQLSANKTPFLNLHNAALILESDPVYKGRVYYDDFLRRVIRRNSPTREWCDADDLELMRHMQANLGINRMGREAVASAVIEVAHRHHQNCVTEWLDSISWDQTPRIDHFFIDCMGATDDEYVRRASRNFWISIVARAYSPGCKVDNMIVLEGPQGVGKSTALQIIGGAWFAEQHESATNPRAFAEILQGKLLVEISEMDAFNKVEVSRVKQTISCRSDRFRAAYSRHAADHPRTCVFVGTTNRDDWARDETGARRFWPIACSGDVDLESIRENRDQLFGEARAAYLAGEAYWKMPSEATETAQRERYQLDPWHDRVVEILKGKVTVTTSEILEEMKIDVVRQGRTEQMRVGTILRFLGWKKGREPSGVSRRQIYKAPVQP